MDADLHALLLGDGRHLADEVCVVFPDLFLGEHPAMRKGFPPSRVLPSAELIRIRTVVFPAQGAANLCAGPAAPDPVAHVRVGGVLDARLGEVPQVVFVIFDFLVAPRQVQRDFRHVVDAQVKDVPHGDAALRVALLDLHEALGGAHVRWRNDADEPDAELFQKQQLLRRGSGRRLRANPDARPNRGNRARASPGRAHEGGAQGSAERHLAELAASGP